MHSWNSVFDLILHISSSLSLKSMDKKFMNSGYDLLQDLMVSSMDKQLNFH